MDVNAAAQNSRNFWNFRTFQDVFSCFRNFWNFRITIPALPPHGAVFETKFVKSTSQAYNINLALLRIPLLLIIIIILLYIIWLLFKIIVKFNNNKTRETWLSLHWSKSVFPIVCRKRDSPREIPLSRQEKKNPEYEIQNQQNCKIVCFKIVSEKIIQSYVKLISINLKIGLVPTS